MEMEQKPNLEEEQERYVPRPWWQVWGARLLLAVFLILLAIYYGRMFL
ncbi:MAG TPA: hypothetical protein IAC31_07005 [Candidatus Faecousia intestinigallinarum]|nr:hypothetical protein [Candidatus Faecousia intestinigallinarum]